MCLLSFTGYQAVQAKAALETVARDFEVVAAAMADGDTSAARDSLSSAQAAADHARSSTRGPVWWTASKVPGIGDDVSAIRTVADVADTLAVTVLPSAVEASGRLSPRELRPVRGRINLRPIELVAPDVLAANSGLQRERDRVAAIELAGLFAVLRSPVQTMQTKIDEAAALTDKAATAVQILPPMLGAEGKRTYLVLFQNNAEIRATGGLPGALATITADDGKIRMARQGAARDLGSYTEPAAPLTREELRLFDKKMGIFPADSNFTPDFPRTAELVKAMWQRSQGETVDGVLATDPVALSYVLEGTGPVELASTGDTLTADNAVDLLLNQVYFDEPDPEAQNLYFEAAARQVFDALVSGAGRPRELLDGLAQSAEERRMLAWSAHVQEQELLSGTPLSGALPLGQSTVPHVGVYFNDSTAAKMHYYFDYEVDVTASNCRDGRQDLSVTVNVRSTAPQDAKRLPVSILGPAKWNKPGIFQTTVLLYAPTGGRVESAVIDGQPASSADYMHEGRPVTALTFSLSPQQQRRISYEVVSAENQPGAVDLRVTPGAHGTGVGRIDDSAC